jgi:hypothetical protein
MKVGRARWLARLKSEGKPIPCGRKKGGVNRSAAERQLAQASNEYHRARRDLKALNSQTFRRQRRQAREAVKREVARLLAEHEDERRQFRFPPLSPKQRKAVIEGFRQRVAVPSDHGSMPWSDIEVLQDRVREAEDALERARADFRAEQMKLGRYSENF